MTGRKTLAAAMVALAVMAGGLGGDPAFAAAHPGTAAGSDGHGARVATGRHAAARSAHHGRGTTRVGTKAGQHGANRGRTGHPAGAGTKAAGAAAKRGARAAPGVARDAKGRVARSPQAKAAFKKSHPCPSTGKTSGACPGFVIDHRQSLKHGGADKPSNMQWQTTAAAKAKDKSE